MKKKFDAIVVGAGLAGLVAAYQLARPRLAAPWPLVVVGPSGWGEHGGLDAEGVVLAGQVEPAVLAGLYARCRCLAYVPLAEGFGLPVVEAMRDGGVPIEMVDLDADRAEECYDRKLMVVRTDQHVAWRGDAIPDQPEKLVDVLTGRTRAPTADVEQRGRA